MHLMRKINKLLVIFFFILISPGQTTPGLMTYNVTDKDPYTKEITIAFTIPKKDFIYKDFITCSVDNPTIILSPWKANKQPTTYYDSSFKEAKQIFNEDFTVTVSAVASAKEDFSANLYCSYYRKSDKKINHMSLPLIFIPVIQAEEIIDTIDTTEHHTTTLKPIKKNSPFDNYIIAATSTAQTIMTSLRTEHKKYFAFLIFIIVVLIAFFYLFKNELNRYINLKEWIEITISLLINISMAYVIIYFHKLTTPFTTMVIAYITTLCTGIFYIKKSTQVTSKNLRTLCTFIGILYMSSTFILSFKALQHADEQFHLW